MTQQPNEDNESFSGDEDLSEEETSLEEWELWHAAYDQSGRKYYYHAESGKCCVFSDCIVVLLATN
jgi:hypothetical protein